MATILLTASGFPAGTSVGLYDAVYRSVSGGGPTGPVVQTQTVAADNSLTYTDVEAGNYVAAAQLGGVWKYVQCSTHDLFLGQRPLFGEFGDGNVAVWDEGQGMFVGGAGDESVSGLVATAPSTAGRNRVTPAGDAVSALILRRRSGQTAELFALEDSSGNQRVTFTPGAATQAKIDSAVDVTSGFSGNTIPAGSHAWRVLQNGTVLFGPSPMYDTDNHRSMPGLAYDSVTERAYTSTLIGRQLGNPFNIQLGRREGSGGVAGETTLSTASVDVSSLPSTITVANGACLVAPTAIVLLEQASGAASAMVQYTTKVGNVLGGLSLIRGSGTFVAGDWVSAIIPTDATLGIIYPSAWDGARGGFQDRNALISFYASENQGPDGVGTYHSGGGIELGTTTLGPKSVRKLRMVLRSNGYIGGYGGWATNRTDIDRSFVIGGPGCAAAGAQDISAFAGSGVFTVDSTEGFPATGVITDTAHVFSYGGLATDGKSFTNCALVSGAGTIANGASLKLDAQVRWIAGAFKGGQVSANRGQGQSETTIGNIGPTTASPEGGIQVGTSSVTQWYRDAAGGKWVSSAPVRLSANSSGTGILFEGSQQNNPANPDWQISNNGDVIWWSGGAAATRLKQQSAGLVSVRNGADSAPGGLRSGRLEYPELGSAPSAVADEAVVFAQDNGGGKTQLMVRMPTGAAIQLAIEA